MTSAEASWKLLWELVLNLGTEGSLCSELGGVGQHRAQLGRPRMAAMVLGLRFILD